MRSAVVLLTLHCFLLSSAASSVLEDLDIRVSLRHDGSALIVETRRMIVGTDGTELYISMPAMGESRVTSLQVVDEQGAPYAFVDPWDWRLSREQKAGKCGINEIPGGYELCWGLGAAGERTYVARYELTGLVRSYPDADAIRHVFLQPGGELAPEHVRLSIERADGEAITHEAGAAAWGFRHVGQITFADGAIVDEAYDLEPEASIYLMVSFPKGIFEPELSESVTFAEKKQKALEGSDYHDPYSPENIWRVVKSHAWWWAPLAAILLILSLLPWAAERFRLWRIRRRVFKDLPWERDIPLGGDLVEAYRLMVSLGEAKPKSPNVLLAMVMRLVSIGAFEIVRIDNGQERLRVTDTRPDEDRHDRRLRELYIYMRHAAGDDKILSPYELTSYFHSNRGFAMSAAALIGSLTHISPEYFVRLPQSRKSKRKKLQRDKRTLRAELEQRIALARRVLGLRKMLSEFTLANERHVSEVTLWREYLVWATLFGIADQVVSDMRRINPDYFQLDALAAHMAQPVAVAAFVDTIRQGAIEVGSSRYTSHLSSGGDSTPSVSEHTRYSGGGGSTSWGGGGGGFSGSGGRTGIR